MAVELVQYSASTSIPLLNAIVRVRVLFLFVTRTTVHAQRTYSMVVRIYKMFKDRILLFFCEGDSPMHATACDGFATSQIRRKSTQNPFSQCVFVGLRTPLNMFVNVSISGVRVDLRGNPKVHSDCPASAGLDNAGRGNTSTPYGYTATADMYS